MLLSLIEQIFICLEANGVAGEKMDYRELPERVRRKIRRYRGSLATPCWIWGGAERHGYAAIWANGAVRIGHRFIYELLAGPIRPGLTLDHLCRRTFCVNPEHLEQVTREENLRRAGKVL
jgi:hypothetical protein